MDIDKPVYLLFIIVIGDKKAFVRKFGQPLSDTDRIQTDRFTQISVPSMNIRFLGRIFQYHQIARIKGKICSQGCDTVIYRNRCICCIFDRF